MTRTIIVNDHEMAAFDWTEGSLMQPGNEPPAPAHARDAEILEHGVGVLRAGEARFLCDQPIPFDSTLEVKGDGRKFVVISTRGNVHVAKPY